jgi:exopolysaccharide production protein ExoQ
MIVIVLPALILLAVLWGTLQTEILSLLGKDATLTGRTILWERAFQLIPEHPWLGQGYDAFWRDDYVESEALWALFQLRHGFSFHNALIEAMVGTGYIGGAVLLYFIIDTFIRSFSWSWRTGSIPASYFVTLMFVLIVRCYVEVDLLYPFGLGTFFCIMSAHYSREIRPIEVTAHLGTLRALAGSDGYVRSGP